MKNILIIYPHWPPSNLAGVHRARLIANFSLNYGWKTIILTVDEKYYEENLDYDLVQTVSSNVTVIKTKSLPVLKIFGKRVIGDIGIRSLFYLYKESKKIIKENKIQFVWIPIPSFYTSLIGRLIYRKFKTPYGIDYIDPWISKLASHEKKFSRSWWSKEVAKILEPIALKNAVLISGVSEFYYLPTIERNFKSTTIEHVSMPYGFDPNDHTIIKSKLEYPWNKETKNSNFVYAGAFLPQSHKFIKHLFKAFADLIKTNVIDTNYHFYFLGTGTYGGKQLKEYANDFEISDYVTEKNERYPYLDILNILSQSSGVLIIGSIEKHYTASKTFQSILSNKPILAMFHAESSAVEVLKESNTDKYLVTYEENYTEEDLYQNTKSTLLSFLLNQYKWDAQINKLNKYSASESARLLFEKIDNIII